MKRFRSVLLLFLILACGLSLFGCSNKNNLVGVYQRESAGNPNSANNRIILYKDGTCSYLGTDNATWSYKGDVVTVTTREPDSYYLDVYFDKSMPDHEFLSLPYYSVMFACADFDSVSDAKKETITETRVVRIVTKELLEEAMHKELYEALRKIEGVQKVEPLLEKGNSWDYELKVVDNCLVEDSYPLDSVYAKVGN